jgi:drug/metabolite transporter (DMT)-like permease
MNRSLPSTLLVSSAIAAIAIAVLVLTTDPGTQQEELFVGLLLVLASGLASSAFLAFGRRTDSPLADTLRALRRGLLFGLAWAGVAVLQINAALTPTNVGFLLLVLLIVEMIFLARRQHPA